MRCVAPSPFVAISSYRSMYRQPMHVRVGQCNNIRKLLCNETADPRFTNFRKSNLRQPKPTGNHNSGYRAPGDRGG